MSGAEQHVIFTLCGQEFRLRQMGETADRMRKVAATLEELIRQRKGRAATGGELRTVLMTAFELAYELAELKEELARLKSSGASEAMDRLLAKIESEMGEAEDVNQTPSSPSQKNKSGTKKKN